MSDQVVAAEPRRRRVLKAPAVRRAELLDGAQRLFLEKGYERTTINDVIAEAGLSKGAFYHHFRAKEDLLAAIALRFGEQAVAAVRLVGAEEGLDALRRLNLLLALSREWKAEHLPQLRAMFTTLLKPENAVLYHRIVGAVFEVMAPTAASVIEQGAREGVFRVDDAPTTAEVILNLAEGRRGIVIDAMARAEAGDVDGATALIMRRVRAEEAVIDRLLGLPPGSVNLAGSEATIREMMAVWTEG